MISVKIFGGLGNQMFQYAFGRALAIQTKLGVVFLVQNSEDRKFGLTHFDVKGDFKNVNSKLDLSFIKDKLLSTANRISGYRLMPLHKQKYIYDSNMEYLASVFNVADGTFLEGYWQSEKYFKKIEQTIRDEFVITASIDLVNQNLMKHIVSANSVSIHIRRGDYVTNESANKVHGVINNSYYYNAISFIKKSVGNPTFFVFSDDTEWVKKELPIQGEVIFVDRNNRDIDDFRLMSCCKHNIIANSSFSWWAAWLNNNAHKVIVAPEKWYVDNERSCLDVFPDNWIKIS